MVSRVQGEPPKAFISYRRGDCDVVAERLARRLKHDLTRASVFFDRLDVPADADDWWGTTQDELRSSDAIVVLIGSNFFSSRSAPAGDGDGADGQWVFAELTTAGELRKRLIRVLVDRSVPGPDEFPSHLRPRFTNPQYLILTSEPQDTFDQTYEEILAGVWVSLVDRVAGGTERVFVISDGTPAANSALDRFLHTVSRAELLASAEALPAAAGLRALRRTQIKRRFATSLPEVIIVTEGEITETLRRRLRALRLSGVVAVSTVGVVGGATVPGGPIESVSDAITSLVRDHLGAKAAPVAGTSHAVGWWESLSLKAKGAVVGATVAGGMGVAVLAAQPWNADPLTVEFVETPGEPSAEISTPAGEWAEGSATEPFEPGGPPYRITQESRGYRISQDHLVDGEKCGEWSQPFYPVPSDTGSEPTEAAALQSFEADGLEGDLDRCDEILLELVGPGDSLLVIPIQQLTYDPELNRIEYFYVEAAPDGPESWSTGPFYLHRLP